MKTRTTRFTLDLDPTLQRALKTAAARRGTTMRRYCIGAIERELAQDEIASLRPNPVSRQWLDRLAALRQEIFNGKKVKGDSAALLRELREERSQYLDPA